MRLDRTLSKTEPEMPNSTCQQQNEYETVTTFCCFSKRVLVETRFNVAIDGKALIHGSLQWGVGNGTPNIENVARADDAAGYQRSVFLLVHYMLLFLEAEGKFSSVRVAAAHNGVLALTRVGFVQATHNVGKALKLAGQELACTNLAAARQACLQLFAEQECRRGTSGRATFATGSSWPTEDAGPRLSPGERREVWQQPSVSTVPRARATGKTLPRPTTKDTQPRRVHVPRSSRRRASRKQAGREARQAASQQRWLQPRREPSGSEA